MTISDVALLVDPDPQQRRAVGRALQARFREVVTADSVFPATHLLLEHDLIGLVIVDAGLAQGVALAEASALKVPSPVVIAVHDGRVSAQDAFVLGRAGVRRFVPKPYTADELLRVVDDVLDEAPPMLVPWVAPFVGKMGLFDFEHEVRRAMVLQAVMASGESRSAAADLLRAPRPVIQRAAPPQTRQPRRRKRRL